MGETLTSTIIRRGLGNRVIVGKRGACYAEESLAKTEGENVPEERNASVGNHGPGSNMVRGGCGREPVEGLVWWKRGFREGKCWVTRLGKYVGP